MPLKDGESYLEYRKRLMDPISGSFCAAKWLNATIWLNSGYTASCHHPPAHKISETEILTNPSAIHNTAVKKQARAQMLKGDRPAECEYCWKIEDLGADHSSDHRSDHVSDRVFKTYNFSDQDILEVSQKPSDHNVVLRYLEIAFDRTCNFACSYCNPSYSTTWVKDIVAYGPYQDLPTDKRNHFTHTHPMAAPFKVDDNPYIKAFWQWWPELSKSLQMLRITGGEPLMSPHVWKILEQFKNDPELKMQLAINSNLGSGPQVIDKLIQESHHIPHLEIFTSNESHGLHAEYIRDGLDWQLWTSNIEKLMQNGNIKRLHCMMTINGLCLFSITELMDQFLDWKSRFGFENPTMSLNILRFPTFQSPLVFPKTVLQPLIDKLSDWYLRNQNNPLLIDFEKNNIIRLIDYLKEVETPTLNAEPRAELAKDLKSFLLQYDQRRHKDFRKVFPAEFINWIDSI